MMNTETLAIDRQIHVVRMDKHRATWYWFCSNPQGGGFGSNHCGSKRVALHAALRGLRPGMPYLMVTGDQIKGQFVA